MKSGTKCKVQQKNKTFVNFLALQVNKATKCNVKKNASEKWNLYIKLWSILKTVRRKQFYKLNATENKTVNFVLFSKKQCSEKSVTCAVIFQS